jgi:hypothetical protein
VIDPNVQAASLRFPACLRLAFVAMVVCMASACAQSPGPVAAPPASTSAAETAAVAAFAGRWAYAQSCGWQHSAELELKTTAEGIRGTWSDGTRVRGEAGELSGEYRDGKMFLRFCRDDVAENDPEACPNYRAENAYAVREAGNLIWYRASGADSYRRYLEMHPVIAGQDIPKDDHCPEED